MARWGFAFFDSGVRFDQPDAHPTSMKNLSRFLENPFDAAAIGVAKVIAFSTDHLHRMISNNSSGELSARITATTSALELVTDCVTDDETRLGIRKARKMAKDAFPETLPASVAKIVAAVTAEYCPGSPEVTECCPKVAPSSAPVRTMRSPAIWTPSSTA